MHVIGTTGCSAEDDAKIAAAARHATIVKSGNMSLGVNLLAVLVEQAARALGPDDFDIEILEMHHRHKVDAPSGTALLLGQAAAAGATSGSPIPACGSRDGHTGARPEGTIGFATLRGGSVVGDHSRDPGRPGRAHHAVAPCRGPHASSRAARSGRRSGRAAASPASTRCATCSGWPERVTDCNAVAGKEHDMSGTLVLVRHGQSEWNLKNLFTGWRDVDLTEQGHAEAKAAGAEAQGARPRLRHRLHLGR